MANLESETKTEFLNLYSRKQMSPLASQLLLNSEGSVKKLEPVKLPLGC